MSTMLTPGGPLQVELMGEPVPAAPLRWFPLRQTVDLRCYPNVIRLAACSPLTFHTGDADDLAAAQRPAAGPPVIVWRRALRRPRCRGRCAPVEEGPICVVIDGVGF